jgi:hypothetical protein
MRPTLIPLLLLAACTRSPATAHAEFDHWIEADGTTYWQLTLTPAAWQQVGRGEPLDEHHQHMSPHTLETLSKLIDASLERMHLCPGEWTMGDVRHFEDGYLIFIGSCDTPAGART